jgi:lipid II:glycine glycyltransferase (peptidoglycan interpeptide bridge formation enzyme)
MFEGSMAKQMPPAAPAVREEKLESMKNCGWQVEVDRTTPAEWSQMLDLFDDVNIYQTFAYGEVRWEGKNLSHLVLKRDGEVLGMAQLRIIRPTPLKFGIAYLRWGPIFERRGGPLDLEVAPRMADALIAEYVENRRLFLRVIPNAFIGTPRAAAIQVAFSNFTQEAPTFENTYRTFVLDLAPKAEELRKNLDPKWRNKLSGAEKNNLTVVAGNGSEEYETFCKLYYQMRKRKTFETTVDVEEFGRIQKDLNTPHRMQILICENKGTPVAGLVVSAMGDSAIYLLGATSDDGLNTKGAYLLQWAMIQWLKANRIRWYDLGGIDPEGNPGVYTFKRGFAGVDICQMNPLVACDSALSSAVASAGFTLQQALRRSEGALNFARAIKRLATRN